MRLFWQLTVLCTIALWADSALAQRQPIADDTLGGERSIVTPAADIRGRPGDRISGGARRGDNLFHSFREFGIDPGRSVYFEDPGVRDILSRVTGGNPSEIFGRLGVLGNANLFLINPSGIIFGTGASLDVNGSFVGTTANAIQFGNQGFFSASEPNAPTLLTVRPSAFLFNQINPAPIENRSIAPAGIDASGSSVLGLRVADGESLLLVGGNINMDNGGAYALGGHIEMGGLSRPGTITLNTDGRLRFPGGVARSDIALTNGAYIDVMGAGDGSVAMNARNLEILGGSFIQSGIGAGLGTVANQAGDITLNATRNVNIGQSSQVLNRLYPNANGRGGNIRIVTRSLSLTDGAQLITDTFGTGNAGDIIVNLNSFSISGIGVSGFGSGLYSQTDGSGDAGNILINTRTFNASSGASVFSDSFSSGEGGNIAIETKRLVLRDGAQLGTSTVSGGQGGNLNVTALESIELSGFSNITGPSQLFTLTRGLNARAAGNLTIQTGQLIVRDRAQVSASTFGDGAGGDLNVIASDFVRLIGTSTAPPSGLFAESSRAGAGGNLTVQTGQLIVQDGALISTSPRGSGSGGNLNVAASESVELSGAASNAGSPSGLFTVNQGGIGDAGNLSIQTRQLTIRDGAQVQAGTSGEGQGGRLDVFASDFIEVSGTSPTGRPGGLLNEALKVSSTGDAGDFTITTPQLLVRGDSAVVSASTESAGDAGDLTINTERLIIQDGGQVSAGTLNDGKGGNLNVTASESIEVDGTSDRLNSGLYTSAVGTGTAGDMLIRTEQITVRNGARVSAGTQGAGDAGNLTIETERLVIEDGAQVGTGTFGNSEGTGGDLRVAASESIKVSGTTSSLTSQTEGTGDAGDLTIETGQLTIQNGAQVGTGTFGEGRGGTLEVIALESVELRGTGNNGQPSGLFAATEDTGDAGDLTIETRQLIARDQAEISVSSTKSGKAGNLEITADDILLNNQAELTAETASGRGGNITLRDVDLLQLRNGSRISTTAGTRRAGGNGGNIAFDSGFIVAVPNENSDIRANAFSGKGGTVDITSEELFGIREREADTNLSDITASSELGVQGDININTPNVDPSRGLVQLPIAPIDASNQIAQRCPINGDVAGEFVITGRGGVPSNPAEILGGETVLTDLAEIEGEGQGNLGAKEETSDRTAVSPSAKAEIVEAQGWVMGADGKVRLTTDNPAVEPHRAPIAPVLCPRS